MFTGFLQAKPQSFFILTTLVAFRIAHRWHDVGVQLGLENELDQIDKNNSRQPVEECCKAMFTQWKLGDKKNVTTAKLIAAVKQGAGDAAYAAKLSKGKKYTTNLI